MTRDYEKADLLTSSPDLRRHAAFAFGRACHERGDIDDGNMGSALGWGRSCKSNRQQSSQATCQRCPEQDLRAPGHLQAPARMSDLTIHNAKLLDGVRRGHRRFGWRDRAYFGANLPARDTALDAAGSLVTPPFVNAHLHLCKVWTLPMMSEEALAAYHGAGMTQALSAIDLASKVKETYEASWIAAHARRAVALAAMHGNLHIRAFADVDGKARLEAISALLAIRDEFRGVVDLQVVAFPQDGVVRERGAEDVDASGHGDGSRRRRRDSVDRRADDAARRRHISFCFDLARAFDADISMLLDDAGDPTLNTLELMAREALARGWEGRCVAHHCRAMALYPDEALPPLFDLLRRARVGLVTDPHTGPLHMRVKERCSPRARRCALGKTTSRTLIIRSVETTCWRSRFWRPTCSG